MSCFERFICLKDLKTSPKNALLSSLLRYIHVDDNTIGTFRLLGYYILWQDNTFGTFRMKLAYEFYENFIAAIAAILIDSIELTR
jgi:hypothetical protein